MSAYLSHVYADRVEILTDGAIYNENGVILDFAEKVYRFQNAPAALTVRGACEPMIVIGQALDMVAMLSGGSFDVVLGFLPRMLEKLKSEGAGADFEMLVAGISETEGPLHVYFTTASYAEGIESCRLYRMADFVGGGIIVPAEEQDAAGITQAGLRDRFAEVGADYMELMRRHKGPNPVRPDLPAIYGIGGHVDHSVIRADGVTTTRLRTWPDVVGEKIDPATADEVVKLTRQQRRATERQERKRVAA